MTKNISLIASSAMLAGLVSATWLFASSPAAATPAENNCLKKQEACIKRCFARYPGSTDKQINCASRTCVKQYNNCMANISSSPGRVGTSDPGKVETPGDPLNTHGGPRGTISGGLLESGPGYSGNGPSATGSPAAPSAPAASVPQIR